jgi:hypothetical protein
MKEPGLRMPHGELPKDGSADYYGLKLNRAVLGVLYIYILKPNRHDMEHEGVEAQDVT